jgi:hypothetical protein
MTRCWRIGSINREKTRAYVCTGCSFRVSVNSICERDLVVG